MSELTVDDFKNVLLDLYLVQRQNEQLQARLAALTNEQRAPEGREDEEV